MLALLISDGYHDLVGTVDHRERRVCGDVMFLWRMFRVVWDKEETQGENIEPLSVTIVVGDAPVNFPERTKSEIALKSEELGWARQRRRIVIIGQESLIPCTT